MLKSVLLLLALVIVANPAWAHAGDHGDYSFFEAIGHFFSEPLHVGAMIAVVGVGAWAFAAKRRQRR